MAEMIPCKGCGKPIWPEGAPLCDACREKAETEPVKPKKAVK